MSLSWWWAQLQSKRNNWYLCQWYPMDGTLHAYLRILRCSTLQRYCPSDWASWAVESSLLPKRCLTCFCACKVLSSNSLDLEELIYLSICLTEGQTARNTCPSSHRTKDIWWGGYKGAVPSNDSIRHPWGWKVQIQHQPAIYDVQNIPDTATEKDKRYQLCVFTDVQTECVLWYTLYTCPN